MKLAILKNCLRTIQKTRISRLSTTISNMSSELGGRNEQEITSFLEQFSPCDISDSLVQHGIANGGFIPNLQLRSPISISELEKLSVGPAYTVLYAPKSDPRPAVKESYIDAIPPGSILIIGLTPSLQLSNYPFMRVNNALYGGLMSTRAKYRGANGSVILGRIRDLDEHNDLNYPVWSFGVGTAAPGPVVKVVGINVPIEVRVPNIDPEESDESLIINPRDYIIADKNGVVRLPVNHDAGKEANLDISSVLEYIPKRVDADKHVAEDIKSGKPAAESQKLWRSKI